MSLRSLTAGLVLSNILCKEEELEESGKKDSRQEYLVKKNYGISQQYRYTMIALNRPVDRRRLQGYSSIMVLQSTARRTDVVGHVAATVVCSQ